MQRSPFHQLDDDWRRYCTSPDADHAFHDLKARTPILTAIDSPAALVRVAHHGDGPQRIDNVFAQLTAHATRGNQHAARFVLQVLVPGLRLVVVRLNWTADAHTVSATVIATGWGRICTYPIDRRPRRISANIIRDTQHRVRRELRHPREIALGHAPRSEPVDDLDIDTLAAADHIRRQARRGTITMGAARIIVATRLHHASLSDLAAATGRSETALRRQRDRAEARLRRAAA